MLEYYSGILFLTTNRPGVLDEAVKSRVHLNLRYEDLTEEQTVAIFKQNIERLGEMESTWAKKDPSYQKLFIKKNEIIRFAREHYNRHTNLDSRGVGRWNGRQIRNAFQIASSLAQYGDEEDEEMQEDGQREQKQLGEKWFKLVEETTTAYDQYRDSIIRATDDENAMNRGERVMDPKLHLHY